ncbi:MAG TPA: hypothetical protein VHD33_04115, partial [Legionellaceae bacterium]|nr:hypothetical protein [Legionellaceae bacterium]
MDNKTVFQTQSTLEGYRNTLTMASKRLTEHYNKINRYEKSQNQPSAEDIFDINPIVGFFSSWI